MMATMFSRPSAAVRPSFTLPESYGKELIVLVTLVEEDGVTGEINLLNVIGQQGKCCVVKVRKRGVRRRISRSMKFS